MQHGNVLTDPTWGSFASKSHVSKKNILEDVCMKRKWKHCADKSNVSMSGNNDTAVTQEIKLDNFHAYVIMSNARVAGQADTY